MARRVRHNLSHLILGLSALMGFLPACGEGPREGASSFETSAAASTAQSGSGGMYVYSPQQNVNEADFLPVEMPDRVGYRVLSGAPLFRVDYIDATKLAGLIYATSGKMEVTFPNDEHATVLEGRVTVTDALGKTFTFKPGDTYFIRGGQRVTWEVPDSRVILSFFNVTTISQETPGEPRDERPAMFVYSPRVKVDESGLAPLGPPEELGGRVIEGSPSLYARVDYQNGNRTAGIFKATTGKVEIYFPFSEHATILEGEVIITDETGQSHTFRPGDSYYVHQGQVVLWDVRGSHVTKSFFNIAE